MLRQLKLARKFEGIRGYNFRRDAGLHADSEPGIHVARGRNTRDRRLESTGSLWSAFRPRNEGKYHPPFGVRAGLKVRHGKVNLEIQEAAVKL